jgi:hypothetical protein
MTIPAHRIQMTLQEDGSLKLDHLPFHAGQLVEVIVLALPGGERPENPYPLRGTPFHLERPTDPVSEADWEVLP